MSENNRVVWSEGLFLTPQHFQQHDRWIAWLSRVQAGWLHAHPWGFRRLEVDEALLGQGQFGLSRAQGILPDGTPFDIPREQAAPDPLVVPDEARGQTVYLALPLPREGAAVQGKDPQGLFRRVTREIELRDDNEGLEETRPVTVAVPNLRLLLDREPPQGFVSMAVARIADIRPEGALVLDEAFIPPLLSVHASRRLMQFLTELQAMLRHRVMALSERLAAAGQGGVAEVADFMLLQLVNRFEPVVAHLSRTPVLHGEQLYATLLALAGELATFSRADRRAPEFPPYTHPDPQPAFDPLIEEIRGGLSKVILERAIAIPLIDRKYGFYVATISDRSLLEDAEFILAVKADMEPEALRRQFLAQVKAGPVEEIQQFVKLALPGIRLYPLPVAPRQVPYHAGYHYFRLDRNSEHWQALSRSAAFAFHVGGQFPNLKMEFWAVRE